MPVYRPFEERLWEKIDRRGLKDLAAQYGISRWQVTNIRSERQWKHG